MSELAGKTALITGASRGIGSACAIRFARSGVRRLILHYGSYRPGVEETAAAVRALGTEVHAIQGDLATMDGIDGAISAYRNLGWDADILINNAGALLQRAKLPDYTSDLFDRVMNLNVKSAYFLSQAVAPSMIANGSGFIVNLSSIAARNGGGPGATIYAAAKAAVAAITKGLAKELAPHGVHVNAVSPGTVDNDFHAKYSNRQMLDGVIAQTPAGRLGDNEEVADTIHFLCTEPSRYIYGQTIEINGGMYMV